MNISLDLYAVINEEGKFFRAKGYSGSGNAWVEDINKAKIYNKIGPARRTVTWFAINYPEFKSAEIVKLSVTSFEIIDEKDRVKKAVLKKHTDVLMKKKKTAEKAYKDAELVLKNAVEAVQRTKNESSKFD